MYQAPPAGNYAPPPPGQAAYGAPPPVQAEAPAEDGKGKKFAKKFGSQVATGAAWGIGMSGKQQFRFLQCYARSTVNLTSNYICSR